MVSQPVVAQSVDEFVDRIEQDRRDTCGEATAPDVLIGLIDAIYAEGLLAAKARGLRTLAAQPGWNTTDQRRSLEQLVVIGRESIALEQLAARAVSLANGELLTGLASASRDSERFEAFLRSLSEANDGKNRFYLAQIEVTLAELLQDRVFQARLDQPVPYAGLSVDEREWLNEAVQIYRRLQAFYSEVHTSSNRLSRDLRLDFEYQIALLEFLSGEDVWRDTLQDILSDAVNVDAYSLDADVTHIFVHSFLRPPFVVREEAVEVDALGEDCDVQAGGGLSIVQRVFSPAIVRTFYNPEQLVEWTCRVLIVESGKLNLPELATRLSRFENHDYRVVVGHFEENDVRFSHLDKEELVVVSEALLSDIMETSSTRVDEAQTVNDGVCNSVEGEMPVSEKLVVGTHQDGNDEGYIYVGTGLPLSEARTLLSQIQLEKNFQGSYLIRPIIE